MKTFRRTGLLTRTALGSALFVAAGLAQPAFAQSTVAGTVSSTASNGATPSIGTAGATTTITANGSRTILNWNSLGLANGETLQYVVAGRGDIVLNRVTSGIATIDGAVRSNIGSAAGAVGGNVWFSAPGGVVFDNNAVVNVGGLLATTADIADADFLDGNASFDFTGAPAASSVDVFSGARLNVSGGTLALVAPNVTSAGTLSDESTGNNADVLFGAAESYTITFAPDAAGDLDLLSWTVPSQAVGTSDATPITVSGTVTAGNIYVGAVTKQSLASALINVSGVLTADGAIASGDGDIILVAGGGVSGGAATAATGGTANLAVGATFANRDVGFSAANGLLTVNSQARSGRNYSVTAQDFTGSGGAFNPYLTTPGGGLTIVDTSGGLTVGGLTAPGNLSISTTNGGGLGVSGALTSTTGNITLNAAGDLNLAGNLTTSTVLRTVSLTASGAISQTAGAIATSTVTGSAGGAFNLVSASNSIGLLQAVTADEIAVREAGGLSVAGLITANNGNIDIMVGSGALALNGATLNAGGGVMLDAGSITLAGARVTSAGASSFNAPVQVSGSNTVTSNGGGVLFTTTVNGISDGNLTVSSVDATEFQAAVGGSSPLGSLTVNGSGRTYLSGNVTTNGTQTYNQAVTLAGAVTLDGGASAVNFNNTLDGPYALTINIPGASGATFGGAVGSLDPLASLSATSVIRISGGLVRTSGSQTYSGPVFLGGNTTLTAPGASFAYPLFGNAYDLTLNLSGASTLDGARITGVRNFSANGGGTTTISGTLTTTGSQTFADALALSGNTALAGTTGSFANGVTGGGNNLTLDYSGTSAIDGAFTGIAALTTGGGGTTNLSGAITTTGTQTYNDAVVLTGATTLASSGNAAIALAGTVDGAQALTVNTTGASSFGGAIGGTTALTSLTTNAGGTTTISGGTIRTTGAQQFNDAVTLGANAVLTGTSGSFPSIAGAGNDLTLNYSSSQALQGSVFTGIRNLAIGGGGITSLTGAISTTGTQTYSDTLSLGAGAMLALQSSGTGAAGNISLSAVTGSTRPLTVMSDGNIALNGAITGVSALQVHGRTVTIDGAIGASGDIAIWAGDITVNRPITSSGMIWLQASGGSLLGTGLVSADEVALQGTNGIGTSSERFKTAATYLTARAAGAGASVYVQDADDVILRAVDTAATSFADQHFDLQADSISAQQEISARTIALRATGTLPSSGITLNDALTASGAISLISNGLISQLGGALVATSLDGSAAGSLSLSSSTNDIESLGAFSAVTGLVYRDANGFTVSGPITNATSGGITLTAASQSMTLAGDVTAAGQTVTLNASSGSVAQTGGIITAGTLTGFISVDASLARSNQIGSIGSLIANSLTLTDLGGLTIAGAVQGNIAAGDMVIRTTGGDLTVAAAGSVMGRNVVLSTDAAFLNQSAGAAITTGAGGHWVIYSATPGANTYGTLDSASTAVWNGTIDSIAASSLTGNRYVFAYQPVLTFASTGGTKVYGTDLTGAAASYYSVSGFHPGVAGAFVGDTAATAFSGAPLVSSPGFAERATVAGGPYAVTLGTGTLSVNGYAAAFANNGAITVTPKAIAGIATASNKTYDGTTAATGGIDLNSIVTGDQVSASASFAFADKNAGIGKTVTVSGAALGGADAGNYTLTVPSSIVADILQKAITGTATANSKTYDGTTTATGSIGLTGVVTGDQVSASASFVFVDKNAGTGKTVAVSGAALGGADAGNYTLTVPASVVADVLQKAITGTATANSKIYDGTTTATGSIDLTDVVTGDHVSASGNFAFADKNAGTGKALTVSGVTLAGADAANYTLTVPASAVASILQKALTANVAAQSKTYDGSTATTGTVALNGVVQGDSVSASAAFTFADRNAANTKTVQVTGAALAGADAGNYTLVVPGTAIADILRRAITVTAEAAAKVEGSADPAFAYSLTSGSLVSGEILTGALAREAGEAPGAYAIGQGTLAASANYVLTFSGATLTIQPAPPAPSPAPSPETRNQDFDGLIDFLIAAVAPPSSQPAPLLIGNLEDNLTPQCASDDQRACGTTHP
jgi:filamentous hemagglutinin family protein